MSATASAEGAGTGGVLRAVPVAVPNTRRPLFADAHTHRIWHAAAS
ncbi:hypothetical protein [Umezawaea beigongshangensis]|nr:hypothetical protein [Umezawaea beigongshangensis]